MTDASSVQSLSILRRLIACDTTSRNSNLELIEYVKSYLDDLSIPYRLTYDDEGQKANLFATVGEQGASGGYVFSGHSDVVPVDGQKWDTNPFELSEKDGKLYGRGTTDMKSFDAVVLAALPEFARRGGNVPIHFSLSYDEEVGLVGVRRLIADMRENGIKPAGCIVGEPTNMKIVTSHKGKRSFRCHVHGLAAHSSLAPSGVNAVEYASAIISLLQKLARQFRETGPFDAHYDCPHTTVHVGTVSGGSALNIVPTECVFEFEFRHLPVDNPGEIFRKVRDYVDNDLLPEMQAVHPDASIKFETMAVIPYLDTDEDALVTQLASQVLGDSTLKKVSYNCEACLFHEADVPTIICGPGDINQAHKPNEYIEIDQIAKCEAFMRGFMERVCVAT